MLEGGMNSKRRLSSSESRSVEEIGRMIRAYVERNPQAGDTLEGIAQWWLLDQLIRTETPKVKAALSWLVACGELSARRLPDGRIFYYRSKRGNTERASMNLLWKLFYAGPGVVREGSS